MRLPPTGVATTDVPSDLASSIAKERLFLEGDASTSLAR
jgi:hypothetical protein